MIETFALALLFFLSFVLSGMEAGIQSLNPVRISRLMHEGNPNATRLHQYLENYEHFLWTIVTGNTVFGFAFVATLSIFVLNLDLALWIRLGVLWLPAVFLFYIGGDFLPKAMFHRYPHRLSLACARAYGWIAAWMAPLVWCVSQLARFVGRDQKVRGANDPLTGGRQAIRMIMRESMTGLEASERRYVDRVLDMRHTPVSQIMTPWDKVVSVSESRTVGEVVRLCSEHGRNRLPVIGTGNRSEQVVGLISLRTLLYNDTIDSRKPLRPWMETMVVVEPNSVLELALDLIQEGGQRLAAVVDHHGRPVGVISIQDILGFIFGKVDL